MKRLFLLFGVFVALAMIVNAQKAPIIAYYHFDNNGADTIAVDTSGNDLDLTLSDATGWSNDGVIKGCLDIDGKVTASTDEDTLFQIQAFTMAMYVRIDPSSTNSANYLVSQGDNYGLWIRDDGAIRFYIHYLAPDQSAGWVGIYATDVNAKDGYWHHIAATFDTTDLVATIYMDGDTVACDTVRNSGSGLTPPPHSQIWFKWDGFSVGSNGGKQFTHGSIDEAMFYATRLDGNSIKSMVADRYPLTTNVEGEGTGTVTPASGTSFYHNDTIHLMAHPGPGCFFKGWAIADSTGVIPDNPVTIPVTDHGVKAVASFATTLLASYSFDEGTDTIVKDASSNKLDLALNADTTWNTDGVVNGCLDLTGRIVAVADTSIDQEFQLQAFTFASYVRIDPNITGANYIMSIGDNTGLWVRSDDGAIRFYLHYLAPDSSAGWVGIYATDVDMRDGLWHHVAVTFDTTDLMASIFVDGDVVLTDTVRNTGTGLVPPPHSQIWYKWDGFSIGANGNSQFTHGSIDEARIYASKLTGDEIKALVEPRYKISFEVEGDGEVVPPYGLYYNSDTATALAVPEVGAYFIEWHLGGDTVTVNPVTGMISPDDDGLVVTAVFGTTMVAHYKFDHEGADTIVVDASNNHLDLAIDSVNAESWCEMGVNGGSFNVNGISSCVTDDDTLFKVQSLTIAAYVRLDPDGITDNFIVKEGDDYGLYVRSSGILRMYGHFMNIQGQDTVYEGWAGINAEDVNLKDGLWHFVAGTVDTTDMVITLYIDGDTVACDTAVDWSGNMPPAHSFIPYSGSGFSVGAFPDDKIVEGSLDDVFVYATRLSGEDIKKLVAQRYALATSVEGNGSVVPADGMFYRSDTLMLTAMPDDGWNFVKWDSTSTVYGTDNPLTVTVQGDVEAKAVFEEGTGVRQVSAFEGVTIYPNPFHNGITIAYDLEKPAQVTIEVFNTIGKQIAVVVNTKQAAGRKTIVWNGSNASGSAVSEGMYFIRLQVDDQVSVLKVIKR